VSDEPTNIVLTANTQPYERSVDSAAVATNRLIGVVGTLTTAIDGAFKAAGRTMQIGGSGMVASVTAAGFAAGRLEQQFSQLQASTEMASKTQAQYEQRMNTYSKAVTNLRAEFGMTSQAAIDLVSQLNRMGQTTQNVQQMTRSFTQLAAVSGEGISGLTQGMISLQRAMGTEGLQATKAMNASLAALSQSAGVSATGVLQFSNSLAPVAKMAGVSQRELMGISTAFVKSGQDGYAAGNAFNKMLTDITRSIQYGSTDIANYANLIGVSVESFKAMPKAEAITQIFEAINAQGPQALKTLERMGLDGVRSMKAIQGVAQSGGIRSAIYGAMGMNDESKMQKASDRAFDGLNDQLKKMAQNGQMIAEAFGSGVLPAMTKLASAVNGILSPMRSMMQALGALPGGAAMLAGLGLVAAGTVTRAFTGLSTLGLATGAYRTMRGGFRAGRGDDLNDRELAQARSYGRRQIGLPAEGNWVQHMMYGGSRWMGEHAPDSSGPSLAQRAGGGIRGAAIGTTRFLGGMLGAGLVPLSNDAWANNMNRDQRYAAFTAGRAGDSFGYGRFQQARAGFSAAMHGEDPAEARAAVAATRLAAGLNTATNSSRQYTTVTGALAGETRALGSAMAQATWTTMKMAGIGAGNVIGAAAPRAWSGMRGMASSAFGMMGGGLGIGLMGGMYAYGKMQEGKEADLALLQDKTNLSPQGVYAAALGEAAAATRSFADVVKEQASKARSTGFQGTPSADEITAANTDRANFTFKPLATSTEAETKAYSQAFFASNPTDSQKQAFRIDLMKKYGSDNMGQVNSMLSAGRSGRIDMEALYAGTYKAADWIGSPSDFFKGNDAGRARAATGGSVVQQMMSSVGASGNYKQQSQLGLTQLNTLASQARKTGWLGGIARSEWGTKGIAEQYVKGIMGDQGTPEDIEAVENAITESRGDPTKLRQILAVSGTAIGNMVERQTRDVQSMNGNLLSTTMPSSNFYRSGFLQAGVERTVLDKLAGRDAPGKELRTPPTVSRAVSSIFQSPGSTAGRAVIEAMSNESNQNLQYRSAQALSDATISLTGNFSQAASALDEIKAAAGSSSSALYQQAEAARGMVRQRQAEAMPYMTRAQQAGQLRSNWMEDRATALANPNLDGAAANAEGSRQAYEARRAETYDQLKSMALQWREFQISRQRQEEDYARSREYALDDYNRSREYAEEDYNRSRKNALADFNRNRTRQEEDYNHQVVVMARETAKTMTNIYERLNVQRTWSASNLLQNMADQQARLAEAQGNLNKLRRAGLSGDAISQMGLNDPQNMQQLARLADDMMGDPNMIRQFNTAAKKRIASGKAVATDQDSDQFKEMRRSFKISMSRSLEEFNIGMARQEDAFQISQDRQANQFSISLDRMETTYDIGMNRARDDLNRSYEEITGDFDVLAEQALSHLTGTANKQMTSLLGALGYTRGQVSSMSKATIKEVNDLFQGLGISTGGTPTSGQGKLMTGTVIINGKRYNAGMMADGGMVPGYSPHPKADNVPIMATAGEYMQPVDAVDFYGKEFMDAVRNKKVPRGIQHLASGGMVYEQMQDWLKRNLPGTQVTSSYRPGAVTALGNTSMHALGKALDLAPSMKTFDTILNAFGSKIYQLFYSPADGRTMLRGAPWHMDPVTKGDHWNHVHWAMQSMSGLSGRLPGSGIAGAWDGGYESLLKMVKGGKNVKRFNSLMNTNMPVANGVARWGNDMLAKDVSLRGYMLNRAAMGGDYADFSGEDFNGSWKGDGALFSKATRIGVGERGPEAVLPLNGRGVDFLFEVMKKNSSESKRALLATNGVPMRASTVSYYSRVDKSTTISGPITVQAQDPDEMLRKLNAKKRMESLKGRH
jgi:TP901 family phage tail tape measure protein